VSELHFYRARPDLAAALRAFAIAREEFVDTVVKPFIAEHPLHEPQINSWSQGVIGFADGAPNDLPPVGLSRSQRRGYLIPARGAAGQGWRDHIARLNAAPKLPAVLGEHGVPELVEDLGHGLIYLVRWMDFGGDDCVIYVGAPFDEKVDAVEPMKRSEFYALREAHGARQDGAA
jgi:hypothetical protein